MNEPGIRYFTAPWGWSVRLVTAIVLLICAAIPVSIMATNFLAGLITAVLLWGLVFATLVFAVRGYIVTESQLKIVRLGWETAFPLKDLRVCRPDPHAMSGSIRLAGNGGVFALTGLFRNSKLGNFRAYATDPERAVVLVFNERTIVVTPGNPAAFVDAIRSRQVNIERP